MAAAELADLVEVVGGDDEAAEFAQVANVRSGKAVHAVIVNGRLTPDAPEGEEVRRPTPNGNCQAQWWQSGGMGFCSYSPSLLGWPLKTNTSHLTTTCERL